MVGSGLTPIHRSLFTGFGTGAYPYERISISSGFVWRDTGNYSQVIWVHLFPPMTPLTLCVGYV